MRSFDRKTLINLFLILIQELITYRYRPVNLLSFNQLLSLSLSQLLHCTVEALSNNKLSAFLSLMSNTRKRDGTGSKIEINAFKYSGLTIDTEMHCVGWKRTTV